MKPRINFITIAVSDLKRSFHFYKDGLGFPTKGIQEGNDDHALFDLLNGFSLVLYRRDEFLKFTANPGETVNSAGFIISHIAESKEEVDHIIKRALNAGAKQIGKTKDEPWGYSANFTDPDGHQWEITYMPADFRNDIRSHSTEFSREELKCQFAQPDCSADPFFSTHIMNFHGNGGI